VKRIELGAMAIDGSLAPIQPWQVFLFRSLSGSRLEQILQRTRDGGIEIVNFLENRQRYYAPGSSAAQNGRIDRPQ